MPKDLWHWLNFNVRHWQMPGHAHKLDHGGMWHRRYEELPGWADCGTWLSEGIVRVSVGHHEQHGSPFGFTDSIDLENLCRRCFAEELPMLTALYNEHWRLANLPVPLLGNSD